MASRKVLQEIHILPPSAEGPQEDVQLPVLQRKQPPAASSWTDIYDECKENVVPPDLESFTEGEDEYQKKGLKILEDSDSNRLMDSHSQAEETISGSHSYSSLHQPAQDDMEMETKAEAGAYCTPSRDRGESHLEAESCHTPLDFSNGDVAELGITTDSFTKCAGTSPKSQLKHRRRSTIGVRGSPEMNFLICQIAKQRSKEKREPDPLENPFISPRNSLLKDKMSAFRNAFQVVDEDEGKPPFPGFSEETESQPERG